MTEPTPTDDSVDDEAQTIEQACKLRSENRNLRERLKAAEERANASEERYGEAAAIVSATQLAEIKRIVSESLHDPDDLLAHQPDMTAYVDEQFASMVDADRVTEQAKELIRQRPHLGKLPTVTAPPTDRPIEGLRSGAMPAAEKPKPISWASAIHGQQ